MHINISKKETEEDLIEIRFQNEDVVQVNFSKLVNKSKYVRDKYKYSEALNSFQTEIDKIKHDFKIKEESIKYFLELIQEEEVVIPKENYKDIYTLSEYFCISKITKELDKIREKELYNDLDFTIEFLIETGKTMNNFDRKLTIKIENFLIERINECLLNSKFSELQISTICRILEKSQQKFNQELLFEFILKSAKTRFILIKYVSLDKLREEKIDELIKFIDEQDESSRKMYLEYIPFNLSFIKILKNKYEQVFKENQEMKKELETKNTKIEELFNKQERMKKEHEEEKVIHERTKEELFNEIEKYKKIIKDEREEKNLLNTKLEKYQLEIKKHNNQRTHDILVSGFDKYNQLGPKSNNKTKGGSPSISPPMKLPFDPSSIFSYSIYYNHSVLITSNNSLKGIGCNDSGRITSSLEKTSFDHFIDFYIKDSNCRQLEPISAVCSFHGTLYMFSKIGSSERQLVLCDESMNGGDPVFLDIGNHHPVALFGGDSHSAVICNKGEIIFINRNSVRNSPNSPIESVSLPDGEKASSVACCDDSVVVLSSNGRVFSSPIKYQSCVLNFIEVDELKGKEIVFLSGTRNHCFAVSNEGRAFGRGSNDDGKLGVGKEIKSIPSFTMISSLSKYTIRAAYAGYWHSLFETREGKILSCGRNCFGELLLSSGPGKDVYSPTETTITNGAAFCIAGADLSVVFIGNGPPINTPNTRVQQYV